MKTGNSNNDNKTVSEYEEIVEKLLQMREDCIRERDRISKNDKDAKLILDTKVVTIGQVLDAIGYAEEV